tara:strand:+ start:1993 stop:2502 length:510 start_codon:yes stop_codon:yes gene_type:complete
MALKSYILTRDFKSPYVTATGLPHNPSAIKFKQFRKGEVVNGEMKHANNRPAFVLVNGVLVVPLDVVKELITKDVVSHADGEGSVKDKAPKLTLKKSKTGNNNPKVKYVDAGLIGAIVGFGGVYFAEHQGYISEPNNKFRLYGAVAGAALAMYVIYRKSTETKVKVNKD